MSFWKMVGAVFVGLWLFAFTVFLMVGFFWVMLLGVVSRWALNG